MHALYGRSELERVLDPREVIEAVAAGFIAYSAGRTVVPPVGELLFEDPPGDCHIKYGAVRGADTFTVKIATGFPRNADIGKSTSNGIVLVFSARTGELACILDDEGFLTDSRTAAAGALAARLLAPPEVACIGILGSGIQARLQLEYLRHVLPTRRALVWARRPERAQAVVVPGFSIEAVRTVREVAARCRLIVTTTASREALLLAGDVEPVGGWLGAGPADRRAENEGIEAHKIFVHLPPGVVEQIAQDRGAEALRRGHPGLVDAIDEGDEVVPTLDGSGERLLIAAARQIAEVSAEKMQRDIFDVPLAGGGWH